MLGLAYSITSSVAAASVCDWLGSDQRPKLRGFGERGMRFSAATHFFENVGEQNILPRLVRLPRDSAALCSKCFVEPILAQPHQDDEPQCFSVVHIQPARAPQRRVRKIDIAFLRVQATEREGSAVVPPIIVREIFDELQGGVGSLRFAKNFGFEADDFPNARVSAARVLKNSQRRFVVFYLMSKTREVEGSDPRAREFSARLRGGPRRRIEHRFGLGCLAHSGQ